MAFALTNSEGRNYAIGIRDMKTKSAADTMEVFKDVLQDVDDRLASTTSDAGRRLLLTIKATMSDRAATEKLFNQQVEDLINKVLPEFRAVEDQLDEADKAVVIELFNEYCGLHTLVHAANCVSAASDACEKGHFGATPPIHNPTFRRANQSGAVRLIQTSCKMFARGADERNGLFGKFNDFIKPFLMDAFKCRSLPLTPFRGSRFNELFHNASVIFALHEKFSEFLQTNSQNMLAKSVQHDLSQPFFVGETRAIAIFSKLYFCPLWRMLEDKSVDANQMGVFYADMVKGLEDAVNDPETLLQGNSPFPDEYLQRDLWWDAVFRPNDIYDPIALTALGVMLPPLIAFLRNHLKEYLPGGKFENRSESEVKGLPKTNKFCESLFGLWDYMLRSNPNMSTLAIESFVLWTYNKTGAWLAAKNDDEKRIIILKAKKDAKGIKEKYKERQEEIKLARRENLEREREAREKKMRDRATEVTLLCHKISLLGGLWESDIDVREGLDKVGTKKSAIIDAVKTQMAYRRKVLEQKLNNAKLWNFSEANISFTPEQMVEKLKLVIRQPLGALP